MKRHPGSKSGKRVDDGLFATVQDKADGTNNRRPADGGMPVSVQSAHLSSGRLRLELRELRGILAGIRPQRCYRRHQIEQTVQLGNDIMKLEKEAIADDEAREN